jgi:hypothetical protein
MNEVDLFGIYLAPAALIGFVTLVLFYFVRRGLDRLQIQRWVWHRTLFDTAVFIILFSLLGLIL